MKHSYLEEAKTNRSCNPFEMEESPTEEVRCIPDTMKEVTGGKTTKAGKIYCARIPDNNIKNKGGDPESHPRRDLDN